MHTLALRVVLELAVFEQRIDGHVSSLCAQHSLLPNAVGAGLLPELEHDLVLPAFELCAVTVYASIRSVVDAWQGEDLRWIKLLLLACEEVLAIKFPLDVARADWQRVSRRSHLPRHQQLPVFLEHLHRRHLLGPVEAHWPLEDFPPLELVGVDLQRACATSFRDAVRLATARRLVGMPSGAVLAAVADIVVIIKRALWYPLDLGEVVVNKLSTGLKIGALVRDFRLLEAMTAPELRGVAAGAAHSAFLLLQGEALIDGGCELRLFLCRQSRCVILSVLCEKV